MQQVAQSSQEKKKRWISCRDETFAKEFQIIAKPLYAYN